MTTASEKDVLTPAQVQEAIAPLAGWEYRDGRVTRDFETKSFVKGVELVKAITPIAEEMNHHPDVLLTWPRVTVMIWTHKVNGITKLDIELARKIHEAAA